MIVIGFALALGAGSCSELKKDLPSPVGGSQIHPEAWMEEAATEFHGTYLKGKGYDTKECQPCHGGPLNGGTSQTSCFQCHALYPHDAAWSSPDSADFHGTFLKAMSYNATECQSCHGTNYLGGSSDVSCLSCHPSYPHNAQWTTGGAASSHGLYLRGKQWNDAECQACHGTNYAGGTSGQSCFTCHDPYPHDVRFTSGGHQNYLYSHQYPLNNCQTCHGPSYTGGNTQVSCMTSLCHVEPGGTPRSPEACNTCHGAFGASSTVLTNAAPPKSVLGETSPTVRGVGAHAPHLSTTGTGKSLKCQECHLVPATLFAPGHIDNMTVSTPHKVTMADTLARLVTGDGTLRPNPAFDGTSCGGTYCHGNWKLRKATSAYAFIYGPTDSVMVGSFANAPVWTGQSAEAACGTCHGLPPQGHATTFGPCANCHTDVVNASMQIIDPTKHINGKINALGQELPMR
jgi:hypothetical protein